MFGKLIGLAGIFVVATGVAAHAAKLSSPAAVRSGPSPEWPIIAEIPAGSNVQVLDCGGGWSQDWCQVRSGSVKGFVAADTLAPSGNNVIVAPVVTTDNANLRQGPGQNYPVVGLAPAGARVNKGSCVSRWGSQWCQINYDGHVGYVHGSLLKREGALFE